MRTRGKKSLLLSIVCGVTLVLVMIVLCQAINKPSIPRAHLEVVRNTKLSYPWKHSLTGTHVFVGVENEPNATQTVWLFIWNDEQGNVDVAAIGTLRVINKNWSWELSRMDGVHGDELIVEVYGDNYETFFGDDASLAGYRRISGSYP